MKLFATLLACIVTVQLAFAISWNPKRNPTHLSHTAAPANSTAVDNAAGHKPGNPQMGSAEFLSTGGPDGDISPWPWRGYRHVIPYCFVDQRSYEMIEYEDCKFDEATVLWSNALGGAFGEQTGHSLAFHTRRIREDFDTADNAYCTSYTYGKEDAPLNEDKDLQCIWSPKYPSDTLAIHWLDLGKSGGISKSSVGYTDRAIDSSPGRYYMHIAEGATAADVAHELGHVLGMVHEHQCWDRDDFIEFRCRNVVGMHDAVERMRAKVNLPEDDIWEKLCTDEDLANEYRALSVAYIKGNGLDGITQPQLNGPDGFDLDSIMMYTSTQGADAKSDEVNVDTAVLVKIKEDANGNKITADDWRIPDREHPSPKDAAFVCKFYPWNQQVYDEWKKGHPDA